MRQYFLKFVFFFFIVTYLFQLNTNILFAKVVLISPPNGFNSSDSFVDFEWKNIDDTQNYVYSFQFSYSINFDSYLARHPEENIFSYGRTFPSYRFVYWRIGYHPISTFEKRVRYFSDIGVFAINKDVPDEVVEEVLEKNRENNYIEDEEDIEIEEKEIIVEEMDEEEEEEEDIENPPLIPKVENQDIKDITKKEYIRRELLENALSPERFQWNINTIKKNILGTKVSTNDEIVCKFNFLKDEYEVVFCNIPELQIIKQEQYPFVNEYSVLVEGKHTSSFNIQIDQYVCDFSLLKPKTWFKCQRKFLKSNIYTVSPNVFLHIEDEGLRRIPIRSFNSQNNQFTLLSGYYKNKDANLRLIQRYRIINREFNIFHEERRSYSLNPVFTDINNDDGKTKPFSFPFEKIIGVTQWYGNTAFQTPHTGIDFGARKDNVLAVSNGQVVSNGWDSYLGDCHSGGNFLRVRQDNGMYTVYFHLEKNYVNTGDQIKRGQIIAKSGNSGAWNCQPLGYHLHFETRLSQNMDSHVNPVRYIDVDWNMVPTLGYKQFPGRLTGENPHPGR